MRPRKVKFTTPKTLKFDLISRLSTDFSKNSEKTLSTNLLSKYEILSNSLLDKINMKDGVELVKTKIQSLTNGHEAKHIVTSVDQQTKSNIDVIESDSENVSKIIEQIAEERFYRRIDLSKRIEELLVTLEKQLDVLKMLPAPLISNFDYQLNEHTTNTIKVISSLSDLMTNQPESVHMVLRFNGHTTLKLIEKELDRLIVIQHKITEITSPASMCPRLIYKRNIEICKVLLGYRPPPKGQNGYRVLCIDGGGIRGLAAIEILKNVEKISGKPIHLSFDYISGVSTGAIIASLIGIQKRPLDEVEEIYKDLSQQIFSNNFWQGSIGLLNQHSYYNSEIYEKILKTLFFNQVLLESAIDPECPKVSILSSLVNRERPKTFLWRNYNIIYGQNTESILYPGTINAPLWKALRASSAAPGYFSEIVTEMEDKIRNDPNAVDVHHDGGLICNNPSFVSLSECKALWPNHELQALVSLGTGRFEPKIGPDAVKTSSLMNKVSVIVSSATDTHTIHKTMYTVLPPKKYFRFNPYLTKKLMLDSASEDDMNILKTDSLEYCLKNDYKFQKCVKNLEKKSQFRKNFDELCSRYSLYS